MTYELLLTPAEICAWSLGALALIASLWLLTAYRSRIAGVGAAIRRQTAQAFNPSPKPEPPAVSIVIVAGDHAEALETLLGKIFGQEYPSPMEVVVVNDGKSDEIKDVITRIRHLEHRDNLFLTFIPENLRNVSRRKLALTLGVKAAHNPVIVALTEESKLYSTQWLMRMVQPFMRPEIEVVIGSALPATKFDTGFGRRYRSFTHGHDAAIWLSSALRGKAWRGHRANMAFRTESFFSSGAMSGALNLRNGDDDIFISKLARRDNTEVVCAAQAAVRYAHPTSRQQFRRERPARFFTQRSLRVPRLFFGASSLAAWTLLLASAGAVALGIYLQDWVISGITAALFILSVVILSLTWRSTLKALRCRPAALGVFPMMLRRPLTNAIHRLRARRNRKDYYTWA
ncbi:MAG: glycosyltransferase [Muribaculaceae bacterium]|nr:glycosyltransferase [Bacteroidales bacterium]MBD5327079.1 glycosyltransferase [Bacteroides sp.]MDE6223180.1 glycosyltransferase [Muribaculaceae bacterium]MDE6229424.1 glycosyltransferase [Muribaculaceae bacterium]